MDKRARHGWVSVSKFARGSCTVTPYDTVCGTVSSTVAARYPRDINRDEQSGVEPRIANRSHLRSMGGLLLACFAKAGAV